MHAFSVTWLLKGMNWSIICSWLLASTFILLNGMWYRIYSNFWDDLFFAFLRSLLNRKLLNIEKLYAVSFCIRKSLNCNKWLSETQTKMICIFPIFANFVMNGKDPRIYSACNYVYMIGISSQILEYFYWQCKWFLYFLTESVPNFW